MKSNWYLIFLSLSFMSLNCSAPVKIDIVQGNNMQEELNANEKTIKKSIIKDLGSFDAKSAYEKIITAPTNIILDNVILIDFMML